MELIENISELEANLKILESALSKEANSLDRQYAIKLVKRGMNFIAYKVGDQLHFAPSRFVGYKIETLHQHEVSGKDGRETTKEIHSILKKKWEYNEVMERLYDSYCCALGEEPHKVKRKFMLFDNDSEDLFNKKAASFALNDQSEHPPKNRSDLTN